MNDIKLNYLMRGFQPIFRGVFGKNELENIKLQDIHLLLYPMNQIFEVEAHIGLHYMLMHIEIVTFFILMGVCQYQTLKEL